MDLLKMLSKPAVWVISGHPYESFGKTCGNGRVLHPFPLGLEFLAALRAFNPLKIHPPDQIRRDRESALRAGLIERCRHFFSVDFS